MPITYIELSGGTVADFKSLALISSLLPVVFLVCFTFMPETPAHLYSTGKLDAARESLRLLRGPGYVVDMELEAIADELAKASTSQAAGLSELVGSRAAAKATIIAVGLMAFQQLSGINAVLFYAAKIFSETGSSILPNTSAMLVGAVQVQFVQKFIVCELMRSNCIIYSGLCCQMISFVSFRMLIKYLNIEFSAARVKKRGLKLFYDDKRGKSGLSNVISI